MPRHKPTLKELVEDVLLNRRDDATERLVEYAENIKDKVDGKPKAERESEEWRSGTVQERLAHGLVKGITTHIERTRCSIETPDQDAVGLHNGRTEKLEGIERNGDCNGHVPGEYAPSGGDGLSNQYRRL